MSTVQSMTDVDRTIGHWLNNIPYIFEERDTDDTDLTHRYSRTYLVLESQLSDIQRKTGNLLGIDFNEFAEEIQESDTQNKLSTYDSCYYIGYFFLFTTEMEVPSVRINGDYVFLPNKMDQTMQGLYDFLRVPTVDLSSIRPLIRQYTYTQPISPPRGREEIDIKGYNVTSAVIWALTDLYQKSLQSNVTLVTGKILRDTRSKYYNVKFSLTYAFTLQKIYMESETRVAAFEEKRASKTWRRHIQWAVANTQKKWVMVPISIDLRGEIDALHANLLLINNHTREVYLLDPWGRGYISNKKAVIQLLIHMGIPTQIYRWKIREDSAWCNRDAFQFYEYRDVIQGGPGGYCASWTIWLMYLVFKYPEIELQDLLGNASRFISTNYRGDFDKFIREYTTSLRRSSEWLDAKRPLTSPSFRKMYRKIKNKRVKISNGNRKHLLRITLSDETHIYYREKNKPLTKNNWLYVMKRDMSCDYVPMIRCIVSHKRLDVEEGSFGDLTVHVGYDSSTYNIYKRMFTENVNQSLLNLNRILKEIDEEELLFFLRSFKKIEIA